MQICKEKIVSSILLLLLLICFSFSVYKANAVTIELVASNFPTTTADIDISGVHPSANSSRSSIGNTFNATVEAKITSCEFRSGSAASGYDIYIVARLYAHSGTFGSTGVPTGGILAESNYVHFTSVGAGWYIWTFNTSQQYTMTFNTSYCIGIFCYNGTWASGKYLNWRTSSSNNTGGAGNAISYASSTWTYWTALDFAFYVYGDTGGASPSSNDLISMIEAQVNEVDWINFVDNESEYGLAHVGNGIGTVSMVGLQFNKYSKSDLEAWALSLNNSLDVLFAYTELARYGIENQTKIEWALDNFTMMANGLPQTDTLLNASGDFWTGFRFALNGFYWSNKFSYEEAKWNLTVAYDNFNWSIYHSTYPGVYSINGDNTTYCIGYGPRFYDEAATTLDCYLRFYEMGITDGLTQAQYIWSWINNNLWAVDHFDYAIGWPNWECSSGGFGEICLRLRYYSPSIGNITRLTEDMVNRYIINGWNSPQWLNSTGYSHLPAIVHHYSSNNQVRLENTFTIWGSLFGNYYNTTLTQQAIFTDFLKGDISHDPAWVRFYDDSQLYNITEDQFKMYSDSTYQTNTSIALAASFLLYLGIVPGTGSIAVTVSESCYEDTHNLHDADLFNMDIGAHTLRIAVQIPGTISFIYNGTVTYNFTTNGIWDLVFASDWNSLVSVLRISGLPGNRMYMYEGLAGASVDPASASFKTTTTILFTAIVSGGTLPYSYQWFLDDILVPGETASTWSKTFDTLGVFDVNVNVTDAEGYFVYSTTSVITFAYTMSNIVLNPTKDTFLDYGVSFPWGSYSWLSLDNTSSMSLYQRIILQFDLSSLPLDSVIYNATLQLYCSNFDAFSPIVITCYRLTEFNWIENEATWDHKYGTIHWEVNGGNYTTPSSSINVSSGVQDIWYNWSVITQSNDAIGNRSNILNLELISSSAVTTHMDFWSIDSSYVSLRPKLTIFYVVPTFVESWNGLFSGRIETFIEGWISGAVTFSVNMFVSVFGEFGLLALCISLPVLAVGLKGRHKYVILLGIVLFVVALALLAFFSYMEYETWIG